MASAASNVSADSTDMLLHESGGAEGGFEPGFQYDYDDEDSVDQSPEFNDSFSLFVALGYKHGRPHPGRGTKWTPQIGKQDLCRRCGKKVYPVEKVDVGVLYHRGCFRCRVCALQLTLKNFQRELDLDSSQTKEVYCSTHVPRQTRGNIDRQALEIKAALDAQKRASSKNRITGAHDKGWNYDPYTHSTDKPNILREDKAASVHRRSTLRSFTDYEKFGVFDAQRALEKIHQQEEEELYRQIFAERQTHVHTLEQEIREEKNSSVKELIEWFEKNGIRAEDRSLGLKKLQEYFHGERQARLKQLLQRLAVEEQGAVARMVDRHSMEMLRLIAKKKKVPTATLR